MPITADGYSMEMDLIRASARIEKDANYCLPRHFSFAALRSTGI